jgi:hypothetical protein
MSVAISDEALRQIVEKFNREHARWADDPWSSIEPDHEYIERLIEMFDTFRDGVPATLRRLEIAVLELRRAWAIYQISGCLKEVWRCREALEKEACYKPRLFETIAELDRQNVPHEQIARMWELVDREGRGLPHLVWQELEHPGSVVGANPEHPTIAAERKELATKCDRIVQEIIVLEARDREILTE